MSDDDLILGGQRVELVLGGDEFLAGEGGDFVRDLDVEAFRSVEAGADSGAAEGQSLEGFDGELRSSTSFSREERQPEISWEKLIGTAS